MRTKLELDHHQRHRTCQAMYMESCSNNHMEGRQQLGDGSVWDRCSVVPAIEKQSVRDCLAGRPVLIPFHACALCMACEFGDSVAIWQ
mmetsp:Transcript_84078/g.148665  ORF Transcript_84078/g.148665 Transcript_84078/m.148665 type:complete len:88 (-) Transcript_84078:132-395(-)